MSTIQVKKLTLVSRNNPHINFCTFFSVPDAYAKLKSDYYLSHVCPTVRMKQLASHWTHFHETPHLRIFRKPAEKIQLSLYSDKNNGTSHDDVSTFITSRSLILRMSETRVLDKIQSHTSYSTTFFFPKILTFMR